MSLGKTANGVTVHDRYNSHNHVEVSLVKEALAKVEMPAELDFAVIEVEMGRNVGKSNLVKTGIDDIIVYAKRPNRNGWTAFVKDRQRTDCSSVVVILKRIAINELVLITSWIGKKSPHEPWDPKATKESLPFWRTHAIVWGSEEVLPETATTMCPW
jgi:hypothetical protein